MSGFSRTVVLSMVRHVASWRANGTSTASRRALNVPCQVSERYRQF